MIRSNRIPAAVIDELKADRKRKAFPEHEYEERKIRGGAPKGWTYPKGKFSKHDDPRVAEWAFRLFHVNGDDPAARPTRNEVAALLNLHGPTTAMESAQIHAKATESSVIRMARKRAEQAVPAPEPVKAPAAKTAKRPAKAPAKAAS